MLVCTVNYNQPTGPLPLSLSLAVSSLVTGPLQSTTPVWLAATLSVQCTAKLLFLHAPPSTAPPPPSDTKHAVHRVITQLFVE